MNNVQLRNPSEVSSHASFDMESRRRVRKTLECILDLLETRIADYYASSAQYVIDTGGGVEGFMFFFSLPKVHKGVMVRTDEQKFSIESSLFSIASSEIECREKLDHREIIRQVKSDARAFVYKLEEFMYQKLKNHLNSSGDDYVTDFSTLIVVNFFDSDFAGTARYWSKDVDHPGFPAVFRSVDENRLLYPKDWVAPRIENKKD